MTFKVNMPRKTIANETAAPQLKPVRAAKPKTAAGASKPTVTRVKSVKHSKAAAPVVVEIAAPSAHERIAKIAYGYWEARCFQPGSPEQDWLRAEQEFLLVQ